MNFILFVLLFFVLEVASVDPNSVCSTDTATSKSGADAIKRFSSSVVLFCQCKIEHLLHCNHYWPKVRAKIT